MTAGLAYSVIKRIKDSTMDATTAEPLLLTEREAAKMMAISASQLAKMRYRGDIKAVHWGYRCIRYTIEEIRAAIVKATKSHSKSRGLKQGVDRG